MHNDIKYPDELDKTLTELSNAFKNDHLTTDTFSGSPLTVILGNYHWSFVFRPHINIEDSNDLRKDDVEIREDARLFDHLVSALHNDKDYEITEARETVTEYRQKGRNLIDQSIYDKEYLIEMEKAYSRETYGDDSNYAIFNGVMEVMDFLFTFHNVPTPLRKVLYKKYLKKQEETTE